MLFRSYPFGYGLSYTTFDYANLKMERLDDGNVVVSFEVTNTGRFAGSEVAQLYVGDEVASVPRPEKELKGYEKVRNTGNEKCGDSSVTGRLCFLRYEPP